MATYRHREETLNTQLAILLSRFGVQADAETIQAQGRERPDVLFHWRGLRVVIEGKFADHPQAREVVLQNARGRVRRGIANIAAAVVYPDALRMVSTPHLLDQLEASVLAYCMISEHEETAWFEGTPAALLDALRRTQETLAQDNLVARIARSLLEQLSGVALSWIGQTGACDRLSELLGMPAPKGETADKAEGRRTTAAKVSALVLANALIFQEQLAATEARATPLRRLEDERDVVGAARAHWQWIWQHINYVPIFQLGERVLGELPIPLALCPVRDLGEIGPDRRRIHEAFDLYHDVSTLHPVFWDHEADQVRTLRQQPNAWLQPRATPRYADRTATADYADYPYHLWKMAPDLLLVERVRTNTPRSGGGFRATRARQDWCRRWSSGALRRGSRPARR